MTDAARKAAEAQLARGEITQADFDWLFGKSRAAKFLVPRKRKSKAHIYADGDTACRMLSTGGLVMSGYRIAESASGRAICANCRGRE